MNDDFLKLLKESMVLIENYCEGQENQKLFQLRFFDCIHSKIIPKYFKPEENNHLTILFYKQLLNEIKKYDNNFYNEIHKGVPYFFIGWYSFLLKQYDQSIFYLDASLAEDKKTHKKNDVWLHSGAANFFKLKANYSGAYNIFNDRKLPDLILNLINKYNELCEEIDTKITLQEFTNKFVEKLIIEDNTAIITTLYSFILEFEDIQEMIKLRSINGGTIEPMIIHLFKGAVIFETLIKRTNKRPDGKDFMVLNGLFTHETSPFVSKYPEFTINGGHIEQLNEILIPLINDEYSNFVSAAFNTVYKIRNSTAHNLSWDDVFIDDNYEKMFLQIINSIFIVIQREYIKTP